MGRLVERATGDVIGNIPDDDMQGMLESGEYTPVEGERYDVFAPQIDGQGNRTLRPGTVPGSSLLTGLQSGDIVLGNRRSTEVHGQLAAEANLNNATRNRPIEAGAVALANTLTFGGAEVAMEHFGGRGRETYYDALRANNPEGVTGATLGGVAISALLTGGGGAAATGARGASVARTVGSLTPVGSGIRAGQAVAGGVRNFAAARGLSPAAAGALAVGARGITEGAIQGGTMALTNHIIETNSQMTAETLMADVGMGAVLGLAGEGVFAGLGAAGRRLAGLRPGYNLVRGELEEVTANMAQGTPTSAPALGTIPQTGARGALDRLVRGVRNLGSASSDARLDRVLTPEFGEAFLQANARIEGAAVDAARHATGLATAARRVGDQIGEIGAFSARMEREVFSGMRGTAAETAAIGNANSQLQNVLDTVRTHAGNPNTARSVRALSPIARDVETALDTAGTLAERHSTVLRTRQSLFEAEQEMVSAGVHSEAAAIAGDLRRQLDDALTGPAFGDAAGQANALRLRTTDRFLSNINNLMTKIGEVGPNGNLKQFSGQQLIRNLSDILSGSGGNVDTLASLSNLSTSADDLVTTMGKFRGLDDATVNALKREADSLRRVMEDSGGKFGLRSMATTQEEYLTALRQESMAGGFINGIGATSPLIGAGLGAALGGPLGATAGALAGGVGQAAWMALVAKPVSAIPRMAKLRQVLGNSTNRLTDSLRDVQASLQTTSRTATKRASGGVSNLARIAPGIERALRHSDSPEEAYIELTTEIQDLAANPLDLQRRLEMSTVALHTVAPEVAVSLAEAASRGIMYLNMRIPRTQMDAFGQQLPPSRSEMSSFMSHVRGVDDPIGLVDDLAAGRVDLRTVEAAQTVHPQLYADIAGAVSQLYAHEISSGHRPSFQMRAQMSMFLNAQLDPALATDFAAAMQSQFAQTSQQAQSVGNFVTRPVRPVMSENTITNAQQFDQETF